MSGTEFLRSLQGQVAQLVWRVKKMIAPGGWRSYCRCVGYNKPSPIFANGRIFATYCPVNCYWSEKDEKILAGLRTYR